MDINKVLQGVQDIRKANIMRGFGVTNAVADEFITKGEDDELEEAGEIVTKGEAFDELEKGKGGKAQSGEIRIRGNGDHYQKQSDNSWKKVPGGYGSGGGQKEEASSIRSQVKKMTDEQLDDELGELEKDPENYEGEIKIIRSEKKKRHEAASSADREKKLKDNPDLEKYVGKEKDKSADSGSEVKTQFESMFDSMMEADEKFLEDENEETEAKRDKIFNTVIKKVKKLIKTSKITEKEFDKITSKYGKNLYLNYDEILND